MLLISSRLGRRSRPDILGRRLEARPARPQRDTVDELPDGLLVLVVEDAERDDTRTDEAEDEEAHEGGEGGVVDEVGELESDLPRVDEEPDGGEEERQAGGCACGDERDGRHWQEHHEPAERGKLVIFPAGPSHIHRGRVNADESKLIATGWINAGRQEEYLKRLAR